MNTPLISIIIAVYNTEKYLEECLDSVLNQSYQNIEAICVNDGSTDNSLNILNKYRTLDKRFKVLSQKNSGSSAARNYALKYVKGQYVIVLDSDDYISKDCIELAYSRILVSDADAVVNRSYSFNEGNKEYKFYDPKIETDEITGEEALIYSINWRIHSRVLWKTSLIKNIGFNTNGIFGDEYTNHLLFSKCKKVAFSDGIYYYRINPNSVTKKISASYFDIVKKLQMLKCLLTENKVYDKSKSIFETLQYNWLKSLQKYYINNKKKFSKDERKYAIKEMNDLFYSLNIDFLKSNYRKTNYFLYLFFCLKTKNYHLFSILTNVIYRIYGK